MTSSTQRTIFVLSDGTGETASIMTRAALVQYIQQDTHVVQFPRIRRPKQVHSLVEQAAQSHGLIVYTVVSPTLRRVICESTKEKNVPSVDLLGPLLTELNDYFGQMPFAPKAGLFRSINDIYFRRIEAMEFTVKHDDGKELRNLNKADVVILGISRTSKTPLSVFMSHKGWKVANIPVILNHPLPKELSSIDDRRIICLTIDPQKLTTIRAKRVGRLNANNMDYSSQSHIYEEVQYALKLFRKKSQMAYF